MKRCLKQSSSDTDELTYKAGSTKINYPFGASSNAGFIRSSSRDSKPVLRTPIEEVPKRIPSQSKPKVSDVPKYILNQPKPKKTEVLDVPKHVPSQSKAKVFDVSKRIPSQPKPRVLDMNLIADRCRIGIGGNGNTTFLEGHGNANKYRPKKK